MAENSVASTMEKGETSTVNWTINNWSSMHKVAIAAESSCFVEVGNAKIRFFLRPIEKLRVNNTVLVKWYCLWAEVLNGRQNSSVKVNANVNWSTRANLNFTNEGTITLSKSKGKVVQVIDEFIPLDTCPFDNYGKRAAVTHNGFCHAHGIVGTVQIAITVELFHLRETSTGGASAGAGTTDDLVVEAENSLIRDLKAMFVAEENFSDLKLETSDNMTIDAHKFLMAARSPVFRKLIEAEVKKNDFKGTMKIDIKGKPLIVILHWMYTGDLDENAGKCMEEVVDAAIKYQLGHLMKVLDRQLITICNKENMFRLYQVAQKNGMPNAMDDISVYIRENL